MCSQIITSIVVFLMQFGFALVEAGMCRQNNVVATYTKNVLDVVFGSMVSYLWGYQVAYGQDPRATTDQVVMTDFFHHLVFQATSATIISGASECQPTDFSGGAWRAACADERRRSISHVLLP